MVTSVNSLTSPANSPNIPPSAAAKTGSGGDFDTFLKMLTAQIQNQDPLNPMENTEFAVQLATFSGVEQQVRTNALLSEMTEGTGGGRLSQVANWIGREVRTTGPVWFGGEPITLSITPDRGADAVNLITLDSQGREIARSSIGTGAGEVDWQGTDASGAPLPAGLYQFRIESLNGGDVIATSDVASYSQVDGAELTQNGVILNLKGGSAVSVDDVTAIRS